MPSIRDLKQSRFLSKEDVARPILVTIKGWHQDNVAMQSEPQRIKYCLDFVEAVKPFPLNVVNGDTIATITGSENFDDWKGTKIVLFCDPTVVNKGEVTGGVRVRAPRNQPAPAPVPLPRLAPVSRPAPVAEPEGSGEPVPGDDEVPF